MSELGTLAATLGAVEAAVLCTNNDASNWGQYPDGCFPSMSDNSGNGSPAWYAKAFDFASSASYDRLRRRVIYKGGAHIPSWDGAPLDRVIAHIMYDVDTHLWHLIPRTAYDNADPGINTHAYRRNALAPSSGGKIGEHFYAIANRGDLRACDIDVLTADIATGFDDNSWREYWDTGGGTNRGFLEYFPDRDSLLWLQSAGGDLYERRFTESAEATILSTIDYAVDGVAALYNPKYKCVLMGGGSGANDRTNWRLYHADGSFTACSEAPDYEYYFVSSSLISVCPVSGEYIIWTVENDGITNPLRVVTYHPITDTWTRRTDIEAVFNAIGSSVFASWSDTTLRLFDVVCTPMEDQGVTMFMSSQVLIYKHTANNWADQGLSTAEKATLGGTVGVWGFDSYENIRVFPTATHPVKYAGITGAACSGLGFDNHTYNPAVRASTEANMLSNGDVGGVCLRPLIDNTVYNSQAGGTGALKLEMRGPGGEGGCGSFSSPYAGLDIQPIPDYGAANFGRIWYQFFYRTKNAQTGLLNGADVSGGFKMLIGGSEPPFVLGSDTQFSQVTYLDLHKNNIVGGYTHVIEGGGLFAFERTEGPTIYLQNGPDSRCQYSVDGSTYVIPPCSDHRIADETWHRVEMFMCLVPIEGFTVTGSVLSKTGFFTLAENPYFTGDRAIYIQGDGLYEITGKIDDNSVQLGTAPVAGSNKTVYFSNYPNSKVRIWLDGACIIDLNDHEFFWDVLTGPGSVPPGFKSIRLISHNTFKDDEIAHPTIEVWYDDLYIGTEPPPGLTATGSTPPVNPPKMHKFRFRKA